MNASTLKSVADRVLAAAGLVACAPVLAASAAAIRLTMGSPVLFVQERPGKHGVPFKLIKFRTMTHDTSASRGRVDPEGDAARLTRVGRFLRATSIDELPQLWNVVRGDMSLVGPRPLLMQYLARYTPEQARRHDVLPGLTGWAQVNGRNALTWDEKFALDVWYVDHWSLALDAKIVALTVLRVFQRQGVSSAGHSTMPEFLGTHARAAANGATSLGSA